jgi:hypothetical protein
VERAQRLARVLALLRALEGDPSAEGERFRAELAALREAAAEALPAVVLKPVAMPYLTGLDVGERIVYERPAPFEHVLEYVQAGAQRFSWEDPRGPYLAAEAHPPDARVTAYLEAVEAFARRWRLGTSLVPRALVYEHVRAAAGEPGALEALAGGEGGVSAVEGEARALAGWLLASPRGEAAPEGLLEFARAVGV